MRQGRRGSVPNRPRRRGRRRSRLLRYKHSTRCFPVYASSPRGNAFASIPDRERRTTTRTRTIWDGASPYLAPDSFLRYEGLQKLTTTFVYRAGEPSRDRIRAPEKPANAT